MYAQVEIFQSSFSPIKTERHPVTPELKLTWRHALQRIPSNTLHVDFPFELDLDNEVRVHSTSEFRESFRTISQHLPDMILRVWYFKDVYSCDAVDIHVYHNGLAITSLSCHFESVAFFADGTIKMTPEKGIENKNQNESNL